MNNIYLDIDYNIVDLGMDSYYIIVLNFNEFLRDCLITNTSHYGVQNNGIYLWDEHENEWVLVSEDLKETILSNYVQKLKEFIITRV